MRDFAASRAAQGHDVRWLQLYDGTELHTTICSDFTTREILTRNHVQDPEKTAFGETANPSWEDFLAFAEKRCQLCLEEDIQGYLAQLGMDAQLPVIVVQKDAAQVNENLEWIRLEILR